VTILTENALYCLSDRKGLSVEELRAQVKAEQKVSRAREASVRPIVQKATSSTSTPNSSSTRSSPKASDAHVRKDSSPIKVCPPSTYSADPLPYLHFT
jgi:hypothetical protein